jgi:hypothetical protein
MASKQRKPTKTVHEPTSETEIVIDFDSNWKFLIVKYILQFIEFFIPDLYADIDTTRKPVFLDNELQTIWRSMKTGLKMTDKLVQVWLKNGEKRLVLVHIEVQARFETLFSKRMFTISYRILDKYKVEPVSLAVFVDTPIPTKFDMYEHSIYGTETRYKYNAYKVIDQIEAELLKRDYNLFALVVLANLRTIQTKAKNEEHKEIAAFDRLTFKKHLYNLLTERNFEPEVYYDLLNFIDYMMILPKELEINYDNFAKKTTEKMADMNKLKPAPGTIKFVDALARDVYGFDMPSAKRQIQVEKRKTRLAVTKSKDLEIKSKDLEIKSKDLETKSKDLETKSKDLEIKSKDLETKSKEAWAAITNLILAFRSNQTAEQLAAIAKISVGEVQAILDAHPLEK